MNVAQLKPYEMLWEIQLTKLCDGYMVHSDWPAVVVMDIQIRIIKFEWTRKGYLKKLIVQARMMD